MNIRKTDRSTKRTESAKEQIQQFRKVQLPKL